MDPSLSLIETVDIADLNSQDSICFFVVSNKSASGLHRFRVSNPLEQVLR